jgi:hypothetical protein
MVNMISVNSRVRIYKTIIKSYYSLVLLVCSNVDRNIINIKLDFTGRNSDGGDF